MDPSIRILVEVEAERQRQQRAQKVEPWHSQWKPPGRRRLVPDLTFPLAKVRRYAQWLLTSGKPATPAEELW